MGVRSKVEDPNILIERQQLQQTKRIHELSKIRNLNEVPIPGNLVTLPDVPLPKIKNILNYIARPAQKTPKTPNGTKSETYHSYESAQSETVESTPLTEDKVFHSMSNGNESPSGSLSNDKELGYEVISKTPEVPQIVATPPEEFKVQPQIVERTPTPPPPEEEEDHFSLADQIKGTPERSMRNKKKKNRRSHEVHDEVMSVDSSVASEEIPPPLPPKRVTPSPKKGMSLESQPSMEEEEIEAIPVKNKLNTTGEGLDVPGPLPPKRDKQSASVEPREITEKITPEVEERIQSRPLPPPPAPPRTLKKKSTSLDEADGRTSQSSEASFKDVHEGTSTETENFRTCAESLNNSKTMRESSAQSTRTEDDDFTLADSVVDSLVSCAETLVGDNENLETCADTLTGGEQEYFSDDDIDNPYPSVDFDSMTAQGPGAGANIVEEDRPGRSALKKSEVAKSESGRRLEEGTQQLSIELMEHVESLKTTLDNMSSRLGTRSRSRSPSKSRPASTFKDSL